jgi:D-alanyl-D-alanine carboxypeptidase/D-alanyl-D-alanine carboxypeptidase (penicillin-binding protein 5/6)
MKKLFSLIILIAILCSGIQTSHAEGLNINANSYILIDSATGQVIYEQNADEKKQIPASTTKIMTAVIALEKGRLDQMMVASQAAINDIGKDGMNIGIMAGERIRMEDLLNALLITSANETANIIAENISPDRQEFVDLMNEKAEELGALDTHFTNTCGAHDENHYTTAKDLAKISQYAMTLPKFREIAGKTTYTFPATNKHNIWGTLPYTNKLFDLKSEYYNKVTGIKSGYTTPAGHNLVSSAVNDQGMELISVIMGVRTSTKAENVFTYSRSLLEYGFKNYSLQTVEEQGRIVKSINAADAEGDPNLELVTKDGLKCSLPNETALWNIQMEEHLPESLNAPINQGDVLGYIEYKRNGVTLGKVDLVASRTIAKGKEIKAAKTVKGLFENPVFNKVLKYTISFIIFFLILRFILRKVSRMINSGKL